MPAKLQESIKGYLGKGYKIVEQLSPTSVVLHKKGLFCKKWLFLWSNGHSNVQTSKQSFRDLTKKLAEKVRLQRVLEAKISWTLECATGKGYGELDVFSRLLVDEEEKNDQMLEHLKQEMMIIENEIRFRNCLGNVVAPLKQEIERCLNVGYELKSHTNSSAILERYTPHLTGIETLNLCIGSDGRIQRSGESSKEIQERLNTLISLFKTYRTFKPTPGREKQVLDKQFELDSEIKALVTEMKYRGYSPYLGNHAI